MPLYLFILLTAIGILLTFCYGDASSQKVMGESTPPATLEDWLVIGPFQIGTREAPWGADPLERHGGFPNISHDADQRFRSSIAPNGEVNWSTQKAKSVDVTDRGYGVSLEFSFPDVDWTLQQSAYGWAALQYQAWARGSIFVDENQTLTRLLIFTERIIEYAIDGERFFGGDFYGFRRAPLVLYLDPGYHTIDLRLVRDVRAMGGVGNPTIEATLEFQTVIEEVTVLPESTIVSSIVDGHLASPYTSITVCNKGRDAIKLLGFKSTSHSFEASFLKSEFIRIVPGQTRPVPFQLFLNYPTVASIQLILMYQSGGPNGGVFELPFSLKFLHLSKYHVHKVTHLHPAGIVSYAILRPPSPKATCASDQRSAPVLLQLHGAGLEADSYLVAHALDSLPDLCAWVLFPTGVTPWSADDWHTWGFVDVRAAISSIPDWIKATKWDGIGIDADKWLVSGHSNGGQGTTYTMTHWPDNVLGATPVSGYLSIPQYVPYAFWRPMEPKKRAIIDSSLNSWRLDLLMENAKCIPVHQQHGSADDNVPVYHSRLMYQSLEEAGSSTSNYTEISGAGHWFDGVMTTDSLREFYTTILDNEPNGVESDDDFSLVVANPADFGSKRGFRILQLKDPVQLGRMQVLNSDDGHTIIKTENVLQFSLDANCTYLYRDTTVDDESIYITDLDSPEPIIFWQERERIMTKRWRSSIDNEPPKYLRTGRQLGGIDAILRTQGPFLINYLIPEAATVAVQISRNLYTYFYADSEIFGTYPINLPAHTGNRITLAVGIAFPECRDPWPFAIRLSSADPYRLSIRNHEGGWHHITASEGSLGAIWVEPMSDERLQLMVWGADIEGLQQAARLVPTVTGVGVPDFVILDGKAKWKGADGVLAMGFFDSWWNVTAGSYIGD